jgi:hypothetical protein
MIHKGCDICRPGKFELNSGSDRVTLAHMVGRSLKKNQLIANHATPDSIWMCREVRT